MYVRPELLRQGWSRDRVTAAIEAEGVPCSTGGCYEIYREKAFSSGLRPPKDLPNATQLAETSLMLLVHPTLTIDDMNAVASAVGKVMSVATL
jgi:dTDP-4-amino-4,6-dideoxygalactose transaminase